MKYIKYCSISLLCFLTFSCFSQQSYVVKKVKSPIIIDGVLDKIWEEAPFTEYFIHLDSSEAPIKTRAKILWDNKNLYIAIVCEDSSIWSALNKRDNPVWDQDAVEIFIDPDGDGQNYIELGFSPNGTICDLLMSKSYFEGGEFNLGYNISGLQCKSNIEGTLNSFSGGIRWICEIAIPFAGYPRISKVMAALPNAGDTWRMNLCRINHSFNNNTEVDLSSWNYLGGLKFKNGSPTFHNPLKFGYITFEGAKKDIISKAKSKP